jgi:hypothetical protein
VSRTDLEALALSLKRTPPADRPRELVERTREGSLEHDLGADIVAARDGDARVAAVNLWVAEVQHALEHGARWPGAGLRIALLAAALAAFFAYMTEPGQLRLPLGAVAIGGLAALTCAQAGRTAERLAERQRRAADALVAAVLGLPPEEHGPPGARGPAGGARRRRGGA